MTDRPYRPDVDGLRGVAILLVVACHGFPNWVRGGFIGVDVFFVISGFLITDIIAAAVVRQQFSFAHFYARRIRRLFPALLVVFAACSMIGWFELLPSELVQLDRHMIGGAGFVANLVLWSEAWYFDTLAAAKPLLHLWSLGVEEQFYLFWPLVLFVLLRVVPRHVMLATVLIAAASLLGGVWLASYDRAAWFYLPTSRVWELLAGAMLALRPLPALQGRLVSACASVLGGLLIVGPAVLLEHSAWFPGWRGALLPVSGAVLILAAGPQAFVNRVLLSRPWLVWIGLISYPLYLWHWPLLSFAYIDGYQEAEIGLRAGLLALSFALAWATWRLVETPIRQGGASTAKVAGLSASMIGVAAVAYWGVTLQGFPGRFAFPPAIDRLAKGSHELEAEARRDACWLVDGNAPADAFPAECSTPTRPAGETVILWGDSYAAQFHPGLPTALKFARTSCPPLLTINDLPCQRGNDFVLSEIARLRPGTVVLFGDWARRYSSWENGGYDARQLGTTLDALKAANVERIIVLGPAPQWVWYLPRLLVARWLHGATVPEIPERTTLGLRADGRSIERVIQGEVERRGAIYVSLLDLMCNDQGCLVQTAGDLTTWDTGHLTAPAARLVGAELRARGLVP
jgi:peptidoglycan/LPS O-acetylase OafA/YrhL